MMKKKYFKARKSLLFLLLLFSAFAFAQKTWNGSLNNNWNTDANWSPAGKPTATNDVVIPNVPTQPTISSATAVCKNLTINPSATLTVGANSITVSGATSVSGTIIFNSTSGTEIFTGLVTVNSGGTWSNTANEAITFRGGITNGGGTFTAGTGIQTFDTNNQPLSGILAIPNATVTGINLTNSGTLNVSTALAGTGTLTNNSTFNIGGSSSISNFANTGTTNVSGSGAISTAIAKFTNTGTINLNGSGAITGITNNAAGTVNLVTSGTITSFNNATATSFLNISDATPTISTLTATAPGNTVNYNGGTQSVKGTTYSNLTLSGSGIKTLGAVMTVNNNLFISAGINLIDNDFQITGNPTGTLTVENNAILQLGGNSVSASVNPTQFPTTFTKAHIDLQTGSQILYNYNGKNGDQQTISTTPTYYNVECQYPGTKKAASGTLNINGFFETASPLDLSTNNPTINLAGDFNLLAVPATVSLTSGVFSIGGDFNNALTVGGSLSNGNGTVIFNGTSAQSILGTGIIATSLYNLIINNTNGGVSIGITGTNKEVTVTNKLTMTNGILTTTSSNLINITNTAISGVSGGTATSFVSGPVKWATPLNASYAFPVGKGSTYLPFILNTNAATGTTAQVEAFDSNCGGGANFTTVGNLSNTEYWSLITTGTFTNSWVSLSRPTAISPLDVIAGSTTVGGTYTSLAGTVGLNGITSSSIIGTNKFFTFGRKNGIRTSAISGSPFCAGNSVSVPYTITGTYAVGNTFTAQLSDALGSFAAPANISSPFASTSAGTISATIPIGSAAGTKYRIRVISNTSPYNVIGEMNNADLTITAINTATLSSGIGTNNQDLCIGKALTSITFNTTGATGIGVATGLPTGVSTSFTGGVISISGTPTVSGTFSYSIPLSGGCGAVSATGTIKINAPTTYTGGTWSDGLPDVNKKAIFATDYTTASGQNINACSCEVKNGAVLRISTNSSLTVQNEITNLGTGSNFIVESEGNLIQVNDLPTNSGNITAQRVFKISSARDQYNYLGTPVAFQTGETYKTIFPGSTTTAVLYHNQATNTFSTSSGANVPGRGSAVKEPPTSTILTGGKTTAQFKGVPQNGEIILGISNSNTTLATLGYNLVGNPYASNIDLRKLYDINGGKTDPTQVTSLNISPTFYFWDNNTNALTQQQGTGYNGQSYALFNVLTGANGTGTAAGFLSGKVIGSKIPTKIVKVGQGFMTRSLLSSYNFKFNNSIRTNATSAVDFLGKGNANLEDDRYWLKMTAPSGIISMIAIVHYPGGNDLFGAEDSRSMSGSDAIYSLVENEKIAINGRSSLDNSNKISLGTNHFTNGNYTIGIDTVEGIFNNGQSIYLKDNQTGIITNLSAGNYTFGANAGESAGRFEIIYKPETVLATESSVKKQMIVYRDASDFIIKSPKTITAVEVYDPSGKLFLTIKPNREEVKIEASSILNGMYILRIKTADGAIVNRKIIR